MSVPPSGLRLQPGVITPDYEAYVIQWLDAHPWSSALARRTQHYGYEYNYKGGALTATTPMSGPIAELAEVLRNAGIMDPDQCIVNEYYRNQGIAAHIDSKAFGPVVAGFSIGADTIMTFERSTERFDVLLSRGALMVMEGQARYEWKHGIDKRVTYEHEGNVIKKPQDYRRISLTYRRVA